MTHVSEFLGENPDAEQSIGKKKGEEREMMLAAQAENEKLLDKDWREGMCRLLSGQGWLYRVVKKMAGRFWWEWYERI